MFTSRRTARRLEIEREKSEKYALIQEAIKAVASSLILPGGTTSTTTPAVVAPTTLKSIVKTQHRTLNLVTTFAGGVRWGIKPFGNEYHNSETVTALQRSSRKLRSLADDTVESLTKALASCGVSIENMDSRPDLGAGLSEIARQTFLCVDTVDKEVGLIESMLRELSRQLLLLKEGLPTPLKATQLQKPKFLNLQPLDLEGRAESHRDAIVQRREQQTGGSGGSLEPPWASSYTPPYRLYGVFRVPSYAPEPPG